MRAIYFVLSGTLAACIDSSSVRCDDGSLCPPATQCAAVGSKTLCVTPGQAAACAGAADNTTCTADSVMSGACHGGVCVSIACGNGLVDPGEQCDDGNQTSGDGCSGDCTSTETCGNGTVDGIKFEQCDDGNLVNHDGCSSTCVPESPHWQYLDLDGNIDRSNFALAYDAARDQIVMFGGLQGVLSSDETWLWSGSSWQRVDPPVRPSPRYGATMAYDATRKRVVLFGGFTNNGTIADTWEWDGRNWKLRATSTPPPPRAFHSMAYDPQRKHVVLFGGAPSATQPPFSDFYEWDGTDWRLISNGGPSGRRNAAMAFDSRRNRLVLFGGIDTTSGITYLHDTWEHDTPTQTWTQTTTSAPGSISADASMAFDPVTQQILLFNGRDSGGDYDLTYSWSGSSWTSRSVTTGFPGSGHGMVTDGARGHVVAVARPTVSIPTARTLEWTGSTWTDQSQFTLPGTTSNQIATDPLRRRAVMYEPGAGVTYEYDGSGWFRRAVTSPPVRDGAALAYDAARGKVVMFGGVTPAAALLAETWTYDGTTWQQSGATGPTPRRFASMVYDAKRGRVLMFGGNTATGSAVAVNETWLWDGTSWMMATPANPPLGRSHAAIGYDAVHDQVVMVGGQVWNGGPLFDSNTFIWDGTDWHQVQPMHLPVARVGASMAWDPARRKLVLFGGAGVQSELQDTWEWDGTDWKLLEPDSLPPPRSGAAMFPDPTGAGVVIAGGVHQSTQTSETWRLRWEGATLDETCLDTSADLDGDGKTSCADADCWSRCTPACPPETSCPAGTPRCGDGVCSPLESCRLCPADCGACTPVCGDGLCDPGESCPGDC